MWKFYTFSGIRQQVKRKLMCRVYPVKNNRRIQFAVRYKSDVLSYLRVINHVHCFTPFLVRNYAICINYIIYIIYINKNIIYFYL